MTQSLKARHETRQLSLLHERLANADQQLLCEQRATNLLVEAMSDEDLNKVASIVQKLSSIKSPKLPKLTAAIEQAEAEINKYTAGGPLVKAWSKIKGLAGIDNPVVKVTTFADALERGFRQIPTILKNNGIDLSNVDLNQSLAALVSGTNQQTNKPTDAVTANATAAAGAAPNQNEAATTPQNKLQGIVDQLRKALSPGGIYGAFKKVPYINSKELAQELTSAPLNVFSSVSKKILSGAKAADVAPDMKAQVVAGGDQQTKHANVVDPSKPSQQTQPSQPVKPSVATTGTKPPGEHPNEPPGQARGGGTADQRQQDAKTTAFQSLKDAGVFKKVGLNDASAQALLKALDDNGMLKQPE